ncbi:glycosyl hydrolase family 8 [Marinoscillum sp.]|uniref:glycosyl hydrolase family 8 n=1 Tax=Marinoscillum sp. TaxID=2024838 RepID=UPI003BAB0A10
MKELILFIICLATCMSCKKQNETAPDQQAITLEISVQNNSENISEVRVFLFDDATDLTPARALAEDRTDENGRVVFHSASDFPNSSTGESLTIVAYEESKPLEFNSLGEEQVTLVDEELITADLQIKTPTQYGYFPTSITNDLAMSEYERWKSSEVVTCNDGLRVIADPASETKVEAIGFGMLLSAYAQDKSTFDGLFSFYKSKRTAVANQMMAWSVTCDGIDDPGSATDGDLDVAFGLIVASQYWGDAYLEEARTILGIISSDLIAECTVDGQPIHVLYPGFSTIAWGGCQMTDLMYHTPAFFRIFADVTSNDIWNVLAEDTYKLLENSAHPETGLVPDWQTAAGTPGPEGRNGHFGYDACRVPWRLALDYLWNGDPRAKAWCGKVTDWLQSIGPENLVDGYELDGTPIGQYGINSAFMGGFTVAAMTHSQSRVNNFGTELAELNDTYWFNLNTRVVYLFCTTGNFYKPEL